MQKLVAAAMLMFALSAQASAMPGTDPADQASMSTKLQSVERLLSDDPVDDETAAPPNLSLLGVMLLGVFGLLWIRRHASEL